MKPECPWCGSDNLHQSGKFDLTVIYSEECVHDFECHDCDGYCTITYSPIFTRKVSLD